MNTNLTNPTARQPHTLQTGHPNPTTLHRAAEIAAAVDAVYEHPTAYRDPTPLPAVGINPPVPQPGRPPMSSKATDDSVRMISAGFLTLCAGGAVSGILHFSGHADPAVIGMMAAVPAGIAVPVLALSHLVKRAKQAAEALPAEQHHPYNGPVTQHHRTTNTTTRGVWATTRNELPH